MTKPKLSELKKGKRYFVYQNGNVVPLVYIYRGYFDKGDRLHDRPSGVWAHLFLSQGNPDDGVWIGNHLGGLTNYSREREAELERKAASWLDRNGGEWR